MQAWLATHDQVVAHHDDDNFNFDISKYFQFAQLNESELMEM